MMRPFFLSLATLFPHFFKKCIFFSFLHGRRQSLILFITKTEGDTLSIPNVIFALFFFLGGGALFQVAFSGAFGKMG